MSLDRINYPPLLETNALIQQLTDESYWLCVTRTVQESQLFPVSPYMLLSYFMAFYRYPELVRKVDAHLPAECIGDCRRNMGIKCANPAMGWGNTGPHQLGASREMIVRDYMILSESDFPWLDDLARDLPYVNLTVPMAIAGWTRDQMIDAGAITYFAIAKDIAHVAGGYDVADGMMIDERAERFRPLLNDEYANASLGERVGALTSPSPQLSAYSMMMHADTPTRMYCHIPYSVLDDGDFTRTAGSLRPGVSHLPPKQDRYTTTQGVLTLAEYYRRARIHAGRRQRSLPPFVRDLAEVQQRQRFGARTLSR